MAENIVDALLVTLGLDSSEYQQGMEDAERTTRDFSDKAPREAERGLNQIESKFSMTFKGIFRSFIAPLTAALGTMGVFSSYTQTADRIGKTANRIGASAEDLQAFGEAAKRAGGSVDGFIGSFESLNGQLQRMQAMGGKGRIAPILKQLGIDATENGKVKDTFQILRELAAASDKLGKREFAGLARFLGLDQGTIMLLQSGRVAMDELIDRQRALGVYTKEDFEITAKFNDSISDLQQVFRSLAAVIMRVIVPPIRMINEGLTLIIKTFREHQGFIVAGLIGIAAVMSGPLLAAAKGLWAALLPLIKPFAAIAALGLIFDEIAVYAEGGETALEGLWRAIGTPEDFRAVGKAIKDAFTGGWEDLKEAAKTVGEYLVKIGDALSPLADTVTPIVNAFKALFSATVELLKYVNDLGAGLLKLLVPVDALFSPDSPGEGWSALKKIVEGVSIAIQSLAYVIEQAAKWLGEMTAKAREALKAFDFVETVRGWFTDLANAIAGMFNPGTPGSEWNALKGIIDGIKAGIDLMVDSVKSLLGWVTKAINAVRSLWGGSGEGATVTVEEKAAVTGGKSEEQYVAEQAAEIKKINPAISDKDATEAAQNQLNADAALHRDYQTFGGDRFSLEQLGYNGAELDAYEERMKAAPPAKQTPAAQAQAEQTPAVKQPATPAATPPAPVARQTEKAPAQPAPVMRRAESTPSRPAPVTRPATPAPEQPAPVARQTAALPAQPAPIANKAPDAAVAIVASQKPDVTNITNNNSTKKEQNIRNETRIDTINVNAPAATNAQGIAQALPAAIRDNTPNMAAYNPGVFGS